MFNKILGGLSKTSIFSKIGSILGGGATTRKIFNEEDFKLLEKALLSSDVGNNTTQLLLTRMKTQVSEIEKQIENNPSAEENVKPMKNILREEMLKLFQYPMQQQIVKRLQQNQGTPEGEVSIPLIPLNPKSRPTVVQICGVNGSGKTTTIGKLLHKYRESGTVRNIVVAAADTVRAAAPDQLRTWVERTSGCTLVDLTESEKLKKQHSTTPQQVKVKNIRQVSYKVPAESVVYEAIQQALRKDDCDLVFVDTAGRLQNQEVSMKELSLINEMCSKSRKGAPDHTWLILDGTIGQNSIQQAKLFQKYVRISGIIVTKLDGSAKGGVILAIANELKIPVLYIGLGESVSDLKPFYPEQFVDSILSVATEEKQSKQSEEDDE